MTQDESLLNEILPKPSEEVIADRFIAATEAADCNGQCRSGQCITVTT